MTLSLASCGGAGSGGNSSGGKSVTSEKTFDGTAYYDSVESRVKFNSDNENNINETFAGGKMSDTYWSTLEGVWQNDSASYPHNGMMNHNLAYVQDGDNTLLSFKGRGVHNRESDTVYRNGYYLPEGACIISNKHLGPGRFEIDMAAMPREGGVSAMWTYCTTTGSEATSQNEIDIEIGGNTTETYMREWCTSWTKHTSKATENVDVSRICYLNDGKIHKYTFDWYTDYPGLNDRRVDWFIDGIYIASIKGEEVPEHEMPLWIGLWFPNWSSCASFEEDYMLVDGIRYTAFDDSQYYEGCRSNPGYTKQIPSKAGIKTIDISETEVNKVSNGDCDSLDVCLQDSSYFGWIEDNASAGELTLEDGEDGKCFNLVAGEEKGEYLVQTISNAYEGYKYNLSFDGKLLSGEAEAVVEIHYSTIKGKSLSKETIKINLDSTDWKTYEKALVVPETAGNLRIDLVVDKGTAQFDNVSLVYQGC
ncbi:MAG: glycoside hydrolase family 16 protein [Bacilli bacterium]|nr:glycoside hydrolase family 16 protein [Bacilli bacterium]